MRWRPFVFFLFAVAPLVMLGCRREPPREVASEAERDVAVVALEKRDPIDEKLQAAREILARGDEPNAIVALNQIINDIPESNSARRNDVRCELATILNNRAPRIFDTDQRAADIETKRALDLCPTTPLLRENRARLLLSRASREDRNVSESRKRQRDWLEESLALHEPIADAHLLMAEAMFIDDDVAGAAAHMKRAAELRPDDPRLAARLADFEKKAAVEGAFRDNRREHFVARFEGDAYEQLSWTALDHLEKAYFFVGKKLGVYPREAITVVIYTGDQYKQVTTVPDWAAGSFDGKIRIREGSLKSEQGELESLLRHEYTHAVVATLPVKIPTWMNEGLAQHFEGEDMDRLRRFLVRAKSESALLPYERMAGSAFSNIKDTAQAQVAYALASLMVKELVDKRGEYALQTLMSRLSNGEQFEPAFEATYAMTTRKVYEDVVDGL